MGGNDALGFLNFSLLFSDLRELDQMKVSLFTHMKHCHTLSNFSLRPDRLSGLTY